MSVFTKISFITTIFGTFFTIRNGFGLCLALLLMGCNANMHRSLVKGSDQMLIHSGNVEGEDGFIGQVTTHLSESISATDRDEFYNEDNSITQSRYKLFLGYKFVLEEEEGTLTAFVSFDQPLHPQQGSFNTDVRSRVPITAGFQLYSDMLNFGPSFKLGGLGNFNYFSNYIFSLDDGTDFSSTTTHAFEFSLQPIIRLGNSEKIAVFGGPIGGLRGYPWVTAFHGWNIGMDVPVFGKHVLLGISRQNIGMDTSGNFGSAFKRLSFPVHYFVQIQM